MKGISIDGIYNLQPANQGIAKLAMVPPSQAGAFVVYGNDQELYITPIARVVLRQEGIHPRPFSEFNPAGRRFSRSEGPGPALAIPVLLHRAKLAGDASNIFQFNGTETEFNTWVDTLNATG